MINTNQYNTSFPPTWCPGCGNWGVFDALKNALSQLNLNPSNIVVVADIGCSGNMADFLKVNMFHSLHGRALPVASGIKLANHKLHVIAVLGDGACYGEGLNHFINLMRGNHDITILVQNNYLYSLTTGQYSPTTPKGTITKSTPEGSIEQSLNPLALALVNHGTFVARGYAFEQKHLTSLIKDAIKHIGFSFIDILQPCITLNKNQTINWYKQRVYKLNNIFINKQMALEEALKTEKLGIGIFHQENKLAYHQEVGLLQEMPLVDISIEKIDINKLIEEFN